MKRFLLFGGPAYYPGGGWDDLTDSFDKLEQAVAAAHAKAEAPGAEYDWCWWHVVDSENPPPPFTGDVHKQADIDAHNATFAARHES